MDVSHSDGEHRYQTGGAPARLEPIGVPMSRVKSWRRGIRMWFGFVWILLGILELALAFTPTTNYVRVGFGIALLFLGVLWQIVRVRERGRSTDRP